MTSTTPTSDVVGAPAGQRGRSVGDRAWVVGLVGLALAAAALSLAVQNLLLPEYSDNLDEGVYVFQARMLLEGQLTLPAETHGEFFRPWLSGEADGRIYTQYQIGLPAYLAASELLLGSMGAGLALLAATGVVAVAGVARALFDDRRTALVAAALVSLSPMLVLHSGLFLTYSLTLVLLLAGTWATLVAADRGSAPAALAAGGALGAALVVRPFDVLVALVPVGALALVRLARAGRLRGPDPVRLAALVAVGVVPFGLVTLWYNARTTGSALAFPNMAADPLNGFGFGTRRLIRSEPTIDYGVRDGLRALGANLEAVPSWLLGGVLLLALAVVGVARPGRGRRAEAWAVVALALAYPLVYTAWWASRLAAEYATNGLGPHYYVPSFAAIGILAARGLVVLVGWAPRPRAVAAGVAALLVAATVPALPDKVADKRAITDRNRAMVEAVPDELDDAVVVVDHLGRDLVLSRYTPLIPDPALTDDVLYAADVGPGTAALADDFPDRDLYRLRNEPALGARPPSRDPRDRLVVPTLRPLEVVVGPTLELEVVPGALPPGRVARALLVVDGRTAHRDLPPGPGGDPGPVTFTLHPDGDDDPPAGSVAVGPADTVVLGVEVADDPTFAIADAFEVEVAVDRDGAGRMRTLAPGVGWHRVWDPDGLRRVRADVDDAVSVEISPGP